MKTELVNGDALETLLKFADEGRQFDAAIADPPYCSGGCTPAQTRGGMKKYYEKNWTAYDDQQDQFSLWRFLRACFVAQRRTLTPGGYSLCFSDWRQIPVVSSAMQSAGLIWRVVVWNKGNARPNKGQFTPMCEFIVYGTNGRKTSPKIAPGSFDVPSIPTQKKFHPSEKPTELIKQLLRILPNDARSVVDPFAGSGSTGAACRELGLDFVGVEISKHYFDIMKQRLSQE